MKYNIKVGERWLIGESVTETIKGTVRGDTTAVFSRMVGEMSVYDFTDNRAESSSFDRITLCDYLRGIVDRQNYGHYLGEIKVIPEDEAEAQLPKRGEWVWKHRHHGGFKTAKGKCECGRDVYAQIDERYETDDPYCPFCGVMNDSIHLNYCPNCGADMRAKMEGCE